MLNRCNAVRVFGSHSRIVVVLELGKLPLQVTAVPEQDLVEKFAPHRADQALHARILPRGARCDHELLGAKTLLSVSNSLSGGDRQLDKVAAVGDPTHVTQIAGDRCASTCEGQRRVVLQRRVVACGIVVHLELGKLPCQITSIPEQDMIEKFSPHRPNQALDEWV